MTTHTTGVGSAGSQSKSGVPELITERGSSLLFETEVDHVAAAGSKPDPSPDPPPDRPPHRPN